MSQPQRLKAYAKLIRSMLSVCSALYELITGEQAPPARDIMLLVDVRAKTE